MAHTNGIESFWATLKRAHKGVYHKISPKHLQRYVNDFAAKHGIRSLDTIEQNEPHCRRSGRQAAHLQGTDCR